jgi:hypothetical protein
MPSYKKKPTRSEKLRMMEKVQAKRIDDYRVHKHLKADPYNILKLLNHVLIDAKHNYNIDTRELCFLLFIYDLEMFSLEYILPTFGYTGRQDNFVDITLYPLIQGGYVRKYSPAQDTDLPIIMARNNKQTTRYCITVSGRKLVKRYLDKLHGRESILVDEKTHFRMFLLGEE